VDSFPPALAHGALIEAIEASDVFFVTGAQRMIHPAISAPLAFSRNMTVVREGNDLTLINAIRLNDEGLQKLRAKGDVTNVVQIAAWHNRDSRYYVTEFGAKLWVLRGIQDNLGVAREKDLASGGDMPFQDCSVFEFRTTKEPEGILQIDRAGGILVSGDALQNYLAPDEFFSDDSIVQMMKLGFFQFANVGPLWKEQNRPQREDFARLLEEIQFQHLLPGHGSPLLHKARLAFEVRFRQMLDV
jgi:hypothetical protein